MLKHTVMWTFKDHAEGADKADNLARAVQLLRACEGLTPGMLRLEVATTQPGLEGNCDLLLYTEFTDQAALDAYQNHPQHVALKPFMAAVRQDRHVMDWWA